MAGCNFNVLSSFVRPSEMVNVCGDGNPPHCALDTYPGTLTMFGFTRIVISATDSMSHALRAEQNGVGFFLAISDFNISCRGGEGVGEVALEIFSPQILPALHFARPLLAYCRRVSQSGPGFDFCVALAPRWCARCHLIAIVVHLRLHSYIRQSGILKAHG